MTPTKRILLVLTSHGQLGDAAIASAVYHATGVRVRDLPILLDQLLD
jgi:hypothetical protein